MAGSSSASEMDSSSSNISGGLPMGRTTNSPMKSQLGGWNAHHTLLAR
jgi:hypothetical protein